MGSDLEVEGVVIPSHSEARCWGFGGGGICLLPAQLRKESARKGEPFFSLEMWALFKVF